MIFQLEFNNREVAVIFWLSVFTLGILISKKTRTSGIRLIRVFFQYKLIVLMSLALIYVLLVLIGLHWLSLWSPELFTETLIWFITAAIVMLFGFNEVAKQENYWRFALVEILKFTLIVEYITNLHTFSLAAELILVPVLVIIGMMQAFSGLNEEHRKVNQFMDTVVVIFGLSLFAYSLYRVVIAPQSLFAGIAELVMPLILSVLFLPFVYLIAVCSEYEQLWVQLGMLYRQDDELRSARRKTMLVIFKSCGLRLLRVKQLRTKLPWGRPSLVAVREVVKGLNTG